MGSSAWWYVVDYQPDLQQALDALRKREFQAGRYFPAMDFPPFPVTPHSPAPGPQHGSIDEAVEAAEETGTRSILDFGALARGKDDWGLRELTPEQRRTLFGSEQPTLRQVEASRDFHALIGRGEGYVVTTYRNGQPKFLYFAGSSFD